MTPEQWQAVVVAALRSEYPGLPAVLPPVIASLVPLWGERVAAMNPTVTQESLGSYQITYSSAYSSAAWISPIEAALLRRYRRPLAGSVVVSGPSAEAAAEREAPGCT